MEELKSSHVSMVSHPNAVTKLVRDRSRSYDLTPAEDGVV
jgi:hypothetical protein